MLWCTQRICSYDGYLCTFFDVYFFILFWDFGDLDLHWCGCVTFKYVKTVVLYYKGAHISIIIHTYMPHDPLPQSFKALPWKGSHQHVVFKFMNDSWDVPDLFFHLWARTRDLAVARLGYFPGEEIFHETLMADGMQDTEAQRGETTIRGTVVVMTGEVGCEDVLNPKQW